MQAGSRAAPSHPREDGVRDTGRDVQAELLPVAKQPTLRALGKAEVVQQRLYAPETHRLFS